MNSRQLELARQAQRDAAEWAQDSRVCAELAPRKANPSQWLYAAVAAQERARRAAKLARELMGLE